MGAGVSFLLSTRSFVWTWRIWSKNYLKTKIIFVCNPNNPTGTIVGRKEVEKFLSRVPGSVLVVFDEAYCEYVTDDRYMDTVDLVKQEIPNIIVLRTFSKIYGLAGLRAGYALGPKTLLLPLKKYGSLLTLIFLPRLPVLRLSLMPTT